MYARVSILGAVRPVSIWLTMLLVIASPARSAWVILALRRASRIRLPMYFNISVVSSIVGGTLFMPDLGPLDVVELQNVTLERRIFCFDDFLSIVI